MLVHLVPNMLLLLLLPPSLAAAKMLRLELPRLIGKYVAVMLRRIAAQRETVLQKNINYSGRKIP